MFYKGAIIKDEFETRLLIVLLQIFIRKFKKNENSAINLSAMLKFYCVHTFPMSNSDQVFNIFNMPKGKYVINI